MTLTLNELQQYASDLSAKHGWDAECINTRMQYLRTELLEAEAEIKTLTSKSNTGISQEERKQVEQALGAELFDIIWNVADIANRFNIDLTESATKKMVRNTNRTFSDKPKQVRMEVLTDAQTKLETLKVAAKV